MRRPLAFAVLLLALATARSAYAEPAARFIYLRGKGTETCPAEADVRQAVVGRLGCPYLGSEPVICVYDWDNKHWAWGLKR